MGDPRRPRKKYDTPLHPWRREKIDSEKIILKEYGLKNKKELWKMESRLRGFFRQAKNIISTKDHPQSKKELDALLKKLSRYSLLTSDAKAEDILSINLKNILDRRLQTQVYRQGLARSISQARQFVVHGHIFIGERKLSVPSYLVSRDEENKIRFDTLSSLSNAEHPERMQAKKQEEKTADTKKEKKTTKHKKADNKKSETKKDKKTQKSQESK